MGELDDILQRLEPSLGPVGRAPAPLEGGITNRNYRALMGGCEYVVRLHGKDTDLLGISREAERLANDTAAGLGIAPAVAAGFEGGLVTEFLACDALQAAEIQARAEELGVALRAFHDSGAELPAKFWVPDLLGDYTRIIRARGAEPPEATSRRSLSPGGSPRRSARQQSCAPVTTTCWQATSSWPATAGG